MTVFERELVRIRNGRRRGLAVALLLELAGYAGLGLLVLCALDLLLALDAAGRIVPAVVVAAGLLGWAGVRVRRVLAFDRRAVAVYADRLIGSRRREVLSAFELSRAAARESGTIYSAALIPKKARTR